MSIVAIKSTLSCLQSTYSLAILIAINECVMRLSSQLTCSFVIAVAIGSTRLCLRSKYSLTILIAIELLPSFCRDRTAKSLDTSPRNGPKIVLDDQVKMLVCYHRRDRTSSSSPSRSRLDRATACRVALRQLTDRRATIEEKGVGLSTLMRLASKNFTSATRHLASRSFPVET